MKQFVILIVLLIPLSLLAQGTTTPPPTPPDKGGIALTLSGGGAKGLYHIGILRALEENEIPIDYISGASMGAIVGSLYASGWSPEKMWDFFLTDSVSGWLSGKIPEKYQSYYSQFEPTSEMVSINLLRDTTKNKSQLEIPTNIIPPYMLDMAIMKLLAPPSAACGGDFNSLMVPFRCIATDSYGKQEVAFRGGYLPFAVRTSMTIPLVFKPLTMDSTVLFDGGILNNFPYQILEEDFAPEHIIGGICTDNFDKPTQDNVVNQIMSIAMRNTDYAVPDSTKDFFIHRVMPQYGMLEYNRADSIMLQGYRDALANMPKIKEIIKERRTKAQVDSMRAAFLDRVPEFAFDSVVITGLTPSQEHYVRRQLRIDKIDHFTYEYFYDSYMEVIAAGVFTSEFPIVKYNPETGYYQIELEMATKARMSFSLGGNISSTSLSQGYVSFDFKTTTSLTSTFSANGHFGMFYNAGKISGRHDFFTRYPFYVDYQVFIEGLNYNDNNMKPYYKNKDWRLNDQQNTGLTTSFSAPVFKSSALKARITVAQSKYDYQEGLYTSNDTPSSSIFRFVAFEPSIETSTINNPLYGSKGTLQRFSLKYIIGQENYTPGTTSKLLPITKQERWWLQARYDREQYVPLASWFTLGYSVNVAVSNHPDFHSELATKLTAPRFAPTPQMQTLFMPEYTSRSYAAAGIMPVFNLLPSEKFFLKTYCYMFLPEELVYYNKEFYIPSPDNFMEWTEFVFGGSLVYQTPIGPASLTLAKYTTGPKNWHIQFNFGYTLFNNLKL